MAMRSKGYIISLLLLTGLYAGMACYGQISSSLFDNYAVSDGLSDKTIHCIFQDKKGWIWIGTDFGVLRFDGYKFKKFEMDTPESVTLSKALIRVIYEDNENNIWIGTESTGVFKFDRKKYELVQYIDNGLVNNSIWDITADMHNNIWIGTEGGLSKYNIHDNAIQPVLGKEKSIAITMNYFIRKLHYQKQKGEYLWIGTDDGIYLYDILSGKIKHYLKDEGFDGRNNEIWEIYRNSKGNIYVGTYLGGLHTYNSTEDKFDEIFLDTENERAKTVRSIIEDKSGNLWVGTRGGLYKVEPGDQKIIHYTQNLLDDYSLIHNSVLDLFVDKKGDLWVGTRNGISYLNFDKQSFGYISAVNARNISLNNSEVYVFWEEDKNTIWVGTEIGGINIYNRKNNSIRYLTVDNGLSNNCIKAIESDHTGNVLIGTYLGGLNQYNLKTGKNKIYYNNPNDSTSISDNTIWDIYTDSQNRIWVGTSKGVDIFDPVSGKFTRYGEIFGIGMVVLIFEDYMGRLWMYSEDLKELCLIDGGKKVASLPYKARSICNDNMGNLWLGTLGNGLVRYNLKDASIMNLTVNDGLCSNVIYGIINQNNRYIWLSTNNGLSRYDIIENRFKNFDPNDGILNSQYNYGAYLKCSDQTLLFGGKKGVDFVFIDKLKPNNYIPPVVLTDFRIFNKSVPVLPKDHPESILTNLTDETNSITVRYDQNMISFEFAALNYANSNKNKYKYMLDGFDKDWNEVGNQRLATYTNLDPGKYILKVLGSNNDNLFSSEGLSLTVIILPPFWKTWWFRFLVILVLITLGYFVYLFIANREKLKHQLLYERQTARKVYELDMMKHEFFMNISHEIRTPLSLILGPLNKLLNEEMDREGSQKHLMIIQRNAQHLIKLVNQLLDYRKIETGNIKLELKKGNLAVFVDEIVNSFEELAANKSIKLKYSAIPKTIFSLFDPDKIEKIINNLLSNALKYTKENGRIFVSVSLILIDDIEDSLNFMPHLDVQTNDYKQFVQIIVRDTGIGIPHTHLSKIFNRFKRLDDKHKNGTTGSGIGLSLTKELVKVHNGYIQVKSKEGKGSKFTVLVPYIEEEVRQTDEKTKNDEALQVSQMSRKTGLIPGEKNKNNELDKDLKKTHLPIIVIVDDNSDIREFIRHHFEPEYHVLEARNGREGWEIALETVPDLIIADIMMPVMDGNELCRKIKKDERTSHIPVVMLTALTSKDKQYAGIDAGAEDYITKPFDIALLKAKVDNILTIRKNLRERFSKELILRPKEIVLSSPDEKFIKRVIQVIEKNIADPALDIDFLAKQTGVSRTQLYRKIKALTDMAAKEFVKDIRLQRAGQLAIQNKLNISEITFEVGFSDVSYFRKCFKEKFGMSASEYAKSHR